MDISLIICTRNRCPQLARCLLVVKNITFDRTWELVIVDNGSTDETAAFLQEFIKTSPVPVAYVYEAKPGLGHAHNAGIRAARGAILAFTDDDCYPAADFLAQTWKAFEDPSVGYISGRIVLHDPDDCAVTINESVTPRTFAKKSFIAAGLVQGANMAFRRSVLVDIGGFDPLFGPGALFNAEDVDAASRASAKGWAGRYCPEVVVRHHHGRKASDLENLLKSYAIGRGAYHMKLLLKDRKILWFARTIYQTRWYNRVSRRYFLWEQVGAFKYAYVCMARIFGRPDRQFGITRRQKSFTAAPNEPNGSSKARAISHQ